ncbi:unnamed protein product [Musa hybrid cultivar]
MASISAASSSSSSLLHVSALAFAFPLRRPPPTSLAIPVIRRPPVPSRSRPRTLKCFSQKQSVQEFKRLFSNLNQVTMKRVPSKNPQMLLSGSVTSGILLVAGTTVGAGILEIPAVTQEAGFLASAITCILCLIPDGILGFILQDEFVFSQQRMEANSYCTPPTADGEALSYGMIYFCSWSYIFIHYALLVAYVAHSSEILTNTFSIPLYEDSSSKFYSKEYQRVIGAINGFLVLGIVVSFTSLVSGLIWLIASGGLQWQSLRRAHFEAIPQSIPIIALSFVYQNVVPVLCTNLEGDLSKVRTAVVLGTAIPLVLFLIWDAVILGTIPNLDTTGALTDPLQQLHYENGIPIVEVFSFFAIATSYIGFVLGLSDFVSDLLKLPSGQSKPLPYLLTHHWCCHCLIQRYFLKLWTSQEHMEFWCSLECFLLQCLGRRDTQSHL